MEEYIMIGFSIMMWFSSALLIFFSISLLKGNYSSVHGKVFETTNDKNGYAKALGKPDLCFVIWSNCSCITERLCHFYCGCVYIIYSCCRWDMVV